MKVKFTGGRWVAITEYSEKELPKAAGMRWDKEGRCWHGDAGCAKKLREYVAEDQLALLDEKLALLDGEFAARAAAEATAKTTRDAKAAADVASSRATDTEYLPPAPEGLTYLAYQRAGIEYAMSRRDTLIADEPGLGKTIQALGVANVLLQSQSRVRMLVVAPKIALWNWRRESEKWLVTPHSVAIWTTKKQDDADIVILNYEILSKLKVELRAREWDVIVYDEAHALKTRDSQRTIAALGDGRGASPIPGKRRLFLTGTPVLNRPVELYPLLHAMGLPEARGFFKFAERYCNGREGRFGYDASGATHMDELQQILRRQVMVRRLKADVLKDLAPKRYSVVQLDASTSELRKAIAAENAAASAYEAFQPLRDEAKAAHEGGDEKRARALMGRLSSECQVSSTDMSRLRRATAVAKIPLVAEHLVTLLEGSEESVLVMAHHKEVVAGIVAAMEEAGYPCAVITGDTSSEDRQRAQDDIQGKRKRVFVGSMRACGVAITLTAASTVVFAEQDWTPGIMSQAEDRAHRIGQQSSVLVQYLVVDGSLDVNMAKAVGGKAGVIAGVLDILVDPDFVPDNAPVVAPVVDVIAPEPVAVEAVAEVVSVVEPVLTPEPVEAVTSVADPAPKRTGRPPRGASPMTQVERNRLYRQNKSLTDIAVPAALAERIRALRTARGGTTAELLDAALSLLESASRDASSEPARSLH
jgi:SWI/SNF-related matrix-associated actin-dependent regulator 1 of chromatin subfamily A